MKNKLAIFCKFLPFILLIFVSFASLTLGAKHISFSAICTGKLLPIERTILFNIRIPRTLLCAWCGALLGATGAVFQGFFRNALADSSIMGVSSGASFGAVLQSTFGFCSSFSIASGIANVPLVAPISLFAFLGALLSTFVIFLFDKLFKSSSTVALLLFGTAVGTFFSALTSIILLTRQKDMHSFYAWTLGSFSGKGFGEFFAFFLPSILAFVLLFLCAKPLDVLGSGEECALALGVNCKKLRIQVLVAGSLASACAVCAGGVISFVGLIAPHIVRKIFGARHRILIAQSMIFGALLLVASDTLARTVIAPSELPVGVIMSLLGVPFFIFALCNMRIKS